MSENQTDAARPDTATPGSTDATAATPPEQASTPSAAPAETAVQEPPPYNIRIEDAGPATKKVWVEVPKETVSKRISDQFKELRHEAQIPGFRKGHAPQKLIEKRFATDVREQVRRSLISETFEQAVEKNQLQVLGEPEFDNPDAIKLEPDAALNYSFSIEIQPDIQLPELKGVKVRKPKIQITDEHVNQAMLNLREQQGTVVPVETRGIETRDQVTADVHIKVDGEEIAHQSDAQLSARAGRVASLWIGDFDKQLAGAKPGETRDVVAKAPENHANEKIRGKEVHIEVTVKDIKRLEPAEVTQEFLEGLGFRTEAELRTALREQMQERITFDIARAMRQQVIKYLLDNVNVELPAKLSSHQTDRVVNRRAVDLMMSGVPQERIEANLESLRGGAAEEGARELKTFFILQAVAKHYDVDVSEAELNGRIAMLAMQRGQRPERFKQELSKDQNMLAQLYVQMREEKAIDRILETAQIEETEPTAEEQRTGEVNAPEPKSDESTAT